jgi:hypothetical protein
MGGFHLQAFLIGCGPDTSRPQISKMIEGNETFRDINKAWTCGVDFTMDGSWLKPTSDVC